MTGKWSRHGRQRDEGRRRLGEQERTYLSDRLAPRGDIVSVSEGADGPSPRHVETRQEGGEKQKKGLIRRLLTGREAARDDLVKKMSNVARKVRDVEGEGEMERGLKRRCVGDGVGRQTKLC